MVAISREPHTPANTVAGLVSELLHLPLYDHEILEHIARNAHVHLEAVQTLDEYVQGRVDEYLTALLRERNLNHTDFMMLLGRTVVSLWEHGACVLMGHGAYHFIPREHALRVRLVAPLEHRVAELARAEGFDARAAARELARRDGEQATYHRRYFNASVGDPHCYDLTLDTGHLEPSLCARLIAESYRLRFLSRS